MKNKTNDPHVSSAESTAQISINTPIEINRAVWYNSANDSGIYCDEYEVTDSSTNETY